MSQIAARDEARYSAQVLDQIASSEFEDWRAEKILTWAIGNFHPRLALSASFGGPEGMVLLHMMHEIEPASRVFVLDTGRLHEATHDLIDRVRERYEKRVEIVFPRADDVEKMVRADGMNLFYESLEKRRQCCFVRKVAPMRRYLLGLDGYVSGLRRDQNPATRADTGYRDRECANQKSMHGDLLLWLVHEGHATPRPPGPL